MLRFASIAALAFFTATVGVGEESSPSRHEVNDEANATETYAVRLAEYRLEKPVPASHSAADILKLLTSSKESDDAKPIEVIRFSALSGSEMSVEFAKRVTVTTGVTTAGRDATTRQTGVLQIGTSIVMIASPMGNDGKIHVELRYESSRLGNKSSDDPSPDVATVAIQGTQSVELGTPTLVGGTSGEGTSFVVLTVTR